MRAVARTSLLMAGLVAAGLLLSLAPRQADTAALDRFVAGHGLLGALVFLAAAAIACAVGLPRQAAAFAAGYAFGAAGGAALALAAQMLGGAGCFFWARALGRERALRRMPARMRPIHDMIVARPFSATLTFRLLPVGSNLLLNLLAGVSDVAAGPFFAATAIGYVPQTIVFALVGSGTQMRQGAQLATGVALFAASAVAGVSFLARRDARKV